MLEKFNGGSNQTSQGKQFGTFLTVPSRVSRCGDSSSSHLSSEETLHSEACSELWSVSDFHLDVKSQKNNTLINKWIQNRLSWHLNPKIHAWHNSIWVKCCPVRSSVVEVTLTFSWQHFIISLLSWRENILVTGHREERGKKQICQTADFCLITRIRAGS